MIPDIGISRIEMREFQKGIVNHLYIKFIRKRFISTHVGAHTKTVKTNQKLPN